MTHFMEACRVPAAATRAAAPPGGSVYCTCHAKGSRGPAAATRAAAPPGGLCTAPATRERAVVMSEMLRMCCSDGDGDVMSEMW